MNNITSQGEVGRISLDWYQTSLNHSCLLPDVGIDESLLKYSSLNSTAQLRDYSDQLILGVPGYAEKLRSAMGSVTQIYNAVGLNALVISLILDVAANRTSSFHRLFSEEAASDVHRTLTDYMQRYRKRIADEQLQHYELNRFELDLSGEFLVHRNTMIDGAMSSQTLKSWVNGAAFHLLMLIHKARLNSRFLRPGQPYCIKNLSYIIDLYLDDLEYLLTYYKKYKIEKTEVSVRPGPDGSPACFLINNEHKDVQCEKRLDFKNPHEACNGSVLIEAYVDHIVSHYEPISAVKSHFLNVQNNLRRLIGQHDVFTLPSTTATT